MHRLLPKWPSAGAFPLMSCTAMSHEAPSGQFICTHHRSVQPFISKKCFILPDWTTRAHVRWNMFTLLQSQDAFTRSPLSYCVHWWHFHRDLIACGQHGNGQSILCLPLCPSRRDSVVALLCCHVPNSCTGCRAYHAYSSLDRRLHHHNISSEFDRHSLQGTFEHADLTTCATLLQRLQISTDLRALRHLHRHIIIHAMETSNNLERLLLYAYGRTGVTKDVLALFFGLNDPDLVSWNFVIGACAKHGERAVSFQLFANMQSQGYLPDQYSYASILSACCLEADLRIGKPLHACIIASIFANDVVVVTALVSMYGKCCSLDRANMAFASMRRQDVVSWNAIITTHAQHGDGRDAMQLYEIMLNEGFIPDKVTFTSIFSGCAKVGALIKGAQLHAQFLCTSSKLNTIMVTSLVNMYGKCGRLLAARRLFDNVPKVDVITWNAMISGYAQNGQGNDALEIFEQMRGEDVKPTKATFIATLEACMNERALTHGKQMHMLIKQFGYESDVVVGTALLTMYGKCANLKEAFTVFDKLIDRTVVSWNALMACYAQGGLDLEVLQLFEQMLGEGMIPDKVTYLNVLPVCSNHASIVECKKVHSSIANSKLELDDDLRTGLVNVYRKLGRMEDIEKVIYSCPKSLSVSLWTALIAAWSQTGACSDALRCFYQMLVEGVLSDKVATISILTAIASQGSLGRGLHVHACIAGSNLDSEINVQNALFSMYGKCGSIDAARAVFTRMITRDAISFKAMVAILVQFDKFVEAINIFWQMLYEGIAPDNAIIATVLNVCGISGLLTQGLKLHACSFYMGSLLKVDDLLVGTALLSMYACCGCLGSAWRVFESLRVKDVSTWTSMMEACAFHGEGRATVSLFENLQKEILTPDRNSITKLLSACSHAGLVNEAGYAFHNFSNFSCSELHVDHYNCMVDLLGRVGQLVEAEEIVRRMPIPPNSMSWSSLLNGCRLSSDVRRGEFAAVCIIELEPECIATYISLANIYAADIASESAILDEI